jgi:hypothetical protein
MDIENVKKRLASLRERAIDKVENNFNKYVLEDFLDAGESSYFLIDSVSWSYYFQDLLAELNELMNYILSFPESAIGRAADNIYMLECIDLKRVIDANILKYELATLEESKVNTSDIFDYIGVNIDNTPKPTPISLTKYAGEYGIQRLHKGLNEQFNYIDIAMDEFENHFKGQTQSPIKWKGSTQDLLMLIIFLANASIIPEKYKSNKYRSKLVLDHFTKPDGSRFNISSINSMFSKYSKSKISNQYAELQSLVTNL